MFRPALFIFFLFLSGRLTAQFTKTYTADLDQLYTILKKTPSFKKQVNGVALKEYTRIYNALRADSVVVFNDYDAFVKLSRLFFPFRDNHLGFYHLPSVILDKAQLEDSFAIQQYRKSPFFLSFPRLPLNPDSLEKALLKKPIVSVEGIYYYGKYLKVGLFSSGAGQYTGVVLSTSLPSWERGQVAIHLFESSPNSFRAIYAHPVSKGWMLYNNERYINGALANSFFYSSLTDDVYKKNPGEKEWVNLPRTEPVFQFRSINSSFQYIRIGTFSATSKDQQASSAFYNRIKDAVNAPHIIIDLRNNSGGSEAVSKKYFTLIKKLAKKSSVHVVFNFATMSQGEIFLLRLMAIRGIKTYGQRTMGTLAYGSNFGKTERLPGGKFQIYITDMKNKAQLLRYESIGIEPGTTLKTDTDWIGQLLELINPQ